MFGESNLTVARIVERLKLWQSHELQISLTTARCHVRNCTYSIAYGIGLKGDVMYICEMHNAAIKEEMKKCESESTVNPNQSNIADNSAANGTADTKKTYAPNTLTKLSNENVTLEQSLSNPDSQNPEASSW